MRSKKKSKIEYQLNPHRHVKIWLSINKDKFMNDENQLRLVQMRSDCPGDDIHLIYDSKLLHEIAILDLIKFCCINQIIWIDIRNLFRECIDLQEQRLIEIYEEEVSNLDSGGNLAAASDVLRWLGPVYSLGMYSDLDLRVNTEKLGASICVKKGILFNIGVSKSEGIAQKKRKVNNNIIAVNLPLSDNVLAEETLETIKKIKSHIINAYAKNQIEVFLNDPILKTLFQDEYESLKNLLIFFYNNRNPEPAQFTSIEFRRALPEIAPTMVGLLEAHLNRRLYLSSALLQNIQDTLYNGCIVNGSGPKSIYTVLISLANEDILDSSFSYYEELNAAHFCSDIIGLNAIGNKKYKSDLSWLPSGLKDVVNREKIINEKATHIQRVARGHQVRNGLDSVGIFSLENKVSPSIEVSQPNQNACENNLSEPRPLGNGKF